MREEAESLRRRDGLFVADGMLTYVHNLSAIKKWFQGTPWPE